MYINEASKVGAPRGSVYLRSPLGMKSELGVRFQFLVTKNLEEYEALTASLKMALRVGRRRLIVHSDSHLVITQEHGSSKCKDLTLSKYLKLIQGLIKDFEEIFFPTHPMLREHKSGCTLKGKSPLEDWDTNTSLHSSLVIWNLRPLKTEYNRSKLANTHNLSPARCAYCRSNGMEASEHPCVQVHFYWWGPLAPGYSSPLQRCISTDEGHQQSMC